jgi:hypothetical protein
MDRQESSSKAFESRAAETPKGDVFQLLSFAFNNKKWWLTPVIVVLLGLGLLVALGGTAAAPFIYSLF